MGNFLQIKLSMKPYTGKNNSQMVQVVTGGALAYLAAAWFQGDAQETQAPLLLLSLSWHDYLLTEKHSNGQTSLRFLINGTRTINFLSNSPLPHPNHHHPHQKVKKTNGKIILKALWIIKLIAVIDLADFSITSLFSLWKFSIPSSSQSLFCIKCHMKTKA